MVLKKYIILTPPAEKLPHELMHHIFKEDIEPLVVDAAEAGNEEIAEPSIVRFALHSLLLHRYPESTKPYADVFVDGIGLGTLSFEPAVLSFQAADSDHDHEKIGDLSGIPALDFNTIIQDKNKSS